MSKSFSTWKKQHDSEDLQPFSYDKEGLLWLKIKSIIRKEIIKEFLATTGITLSSTTLTKQFEELYNLLSSDVESSHEIINHFILKKNIEIIGNLNQEQLVSELYKLKVFEWGGDYQNSLDKYLVSRYVKAISSYDVLLSKFDTEINRAVQGYVLNSWYNHWSSILIEHLFKTHSSVIPTVGQIKSVDFFINDVPFDLKVTYFPTEYLKQKRKEKGLPVELTFFKAKARELGIPFNSDNSPSNIYYEITEKLKDRGDSKSLNVLKEIKESNHLIVKETKESPKILAKWLYENQGEMRFGSENRLFLVLIDINDFSSSWKLKRNIDLLRPSIYSFLDDFCNKDIQDLKIEFTYPGRPQVFNTLADTIFIIK